MKKVKKYFITAVTSLQSNLAYRANFLFEMFFLFLIVFVFSQLWNAIYNGRSVIAGYTWQQMIWYFITAEVVVLSGGGIFQNLSTEIKNGSIAYILNKPYHYIPYMLSNSLGLIVIKLILNSAAGVFIGMVLIGPLYGFRLWYIPFIGLSVLAGILLNFFLQTCIGFTAFWVEENSAFYWIQSKLVLLFGLLLPVEFFPHRAQIIIRFLPFPYVTYGPAKLMADFSPERMVQLFSVQLIYCMVFGVLAFVIYGRGVKMLNVNGG